MNLKRSQTHKHNVVGVVIDVCFTLRRMALVAAANTGSAAFTIWPKETAPAPKARTEKAWARAAQRPTGESSFQLSRESWGALRTPVALHNHSQKKIYFIIQKGGFKTDQSGKTKRTPTRSWHD